MGKFLLWVRCWTLTQRPNRDFEPALAAARVGQSPCFRETRGAAICRSDLSILPFFCLLLLFFCFLFFGFSTYFIILPFINSQWVFHKTFFQHQQAIKTHIFQIKSHKKFEVVSIQIIILKVHENHGLGIPQVQGLAQRMEYAVQGVYLHFSYAFG